MGNLAGDSGQAMCNFWVVVQATLCDNIICCVRASPTEGK